MTHNYQIITPAGEDLIGLQHQIAQWETDAIATLNDLKEPFLLWEFVKADFKKYAKYTPYKSLKNLVGESLYNQNEDLRKQTLDYAGMIKKLLKNELLIVGYTTDNGKTIELGLINAKTYRDLMALEGLSAIFEFLCIIIVGTIAVIGSLIAYKSIEANRLATVAKTVSDLTALEATRKIAETAKIDPALASQMAQWWKNRKDAAAAVDNKSWWERATESIKTIGVSGFGGLAAGLIVALLLGRQQKSRR